MFTSCSCSWVFWQFIGTVFPGFFWRGVSVNGLFQPTHESEALSETHLTCKVLRIALKKNLNDVLTKVTDEKNNLFVSGRNWILWFKTQMQCACFTQFVGQVGQMRVDKEVYCTMNQLPNCGQNTGLSFWQWKYIRHLCLLFSYLFSFISNFCFLFCHEIGIIELLKMLTLSRSEMVDIMRI